MIKNEMALKIQV